MSLNYISEYKMEYYFLFILCLNIIFIICLYFLYRKSKICENQEYYLSFIHNHNTNMKTIPKKKIHSKKKNEYMTRQQKNKLFVITQHPVDCSYILYLFHTYKDIHYICWTSHQNLDWTLFEKSRDTYITLLFLKSKKTFSKEFILIQKSFFSMEMLSFLNEYPHWNIFWTTLLKNHFRKKKSSSSLLYTTFFTIYFDCINDQLETYIYPFHSSFQSYDNNNLMQCWIGNGTNVEFLNTCYQSAQKFYHNHYIFFTDFEMKQFILKTEEKAA